MEEQIEKRESKKEFQLPKKVVILKPLLDRTPGLVKDKNHVGSFLLPGCDRIICPPALEGQSTIDCPLTEEERAFFEDKKKSGLTFEMGDLNVYSKKWGKKGGLNWWQTRDARIRLTDDEKRFDLSNPMDYIRYKICLKNNQLVAESRDALKYNPEALYVFEEVADNIRKKATSVNKKIEAFALLSNMSKDKDRMIDICLALGKKVSETQEVSALTAVLGQFIEDDLDKFLDTVNDEYFDEKVLMGKFLRNKQIQRKGYNYYLADGTPMCDRGESPTLENACFFLRQPENQDTRLILEAKLKEKK